MAVCPARSYAVFSAEFSRISQSNIVLRIGWENRLRGTMIPKKYNLHMFLNFIFIHKLFCLLAIPPAPNWAVFSAECSAVIDLFAQLHDLDEIATEQDQCKKTPLLIFSNHMPISGQFFKVSWSHENNQCGCATTSFLRSIQPCMESGCSIANSRNIRVLVWPATKRLTMSLCAFLFVYL